MTLWRLLRVLGLGLAGIAGLIAVAIGVLRGAAALRETATAEALAPKSGRFVPTAHGRLFLQDEGPRDGMPVVLIHGTAAWSEFWRGTIDHLVGEGFRVIAVDLPPFGFSDRSAEAAYTRADQAVRLRDALEHMKIDKAVLVGHSFGGGATVETAMRYPERVRALVLIAPALGLPENDESVGSSRRGGLLASPMIAQTLIAATATNPLLTRWLLAKMLAVKEAATPELAAVLQRPMRLRHTTADFGRWLGYFLSTESAALSMRPSAYRNLPGRTHLIWGEEDAITPLIQGRRLRRLITSSHLVIMRGLGHIPQI